jgi:hypothetical protein
MKAIEVNKNTYIFLVRCFFPLWMPWQQGLAMLGAYFFSKMEAD